MNKADAQLLQLTNENNRLNNNGFIQLHFAPKDQVRQEHFKKVYLVQHEGQDIYMKLIDFARIPFWRIGSILTVAATGLDVAQWVKQWVERYPHTQHDTEMAVYCYQRIQPTG